MIRRPPRSPLFPYTTLSRSVRFRDDLAENIANGDANYLAMLDAADDYIRRNGLDLPEEPEARRRLPDPEDRKSTRLNSSHLVISYAVFCLKKKKADLAMPAI